MFNWYRNIKRRRLLKTPFPIQWREVITEKVPHYNYLDKEEKLQLEDLVRFFIAEKNFEGCNGLEITDEIRVVIASQACLLVLALPPFQYKALRTVVVYPTTVTIPPSRISTFAEGAQIVPDQQAIQGQAWMRGPVILVWDSVKRGTRHPTDGHNVVYHEFAHILDMRDGSGDGTPELHSIRLYKQWVEVCTKEYFRLQNDVKKNRKTVLDSYGAVHEAEFFAVATELFFDRPLTLKKEIPRLYEVLSAYYRQDTAERQLRFRRRGTVK